LIGTSTSAKGKFGPDVFRFIMRNRRFRKIPKVLETPKGKDMREDVENLRILRELAEKQ
jgi:deoxyribonuclease IV